VLVLSNSLGTTGGIWDGVVAALGPERRVLRYDHRGHGSSPAPHGPYTLEQLGTDVLALLDALELERVSFCGVSLGGMVAQWLGIHAPERLERLVIQCSSPYLGPASAWSQRAAMVRAAQSVGAVAEAVVERWLTPEFAAAHPEVRRRLHGMLLATPYESYAACCEAIGAMDLRAELARITVPTLVIGAERDPSTPVEPHARLMAESIPGARLVVVEDAAHLAGVQRPQALAALIAEHLG
jgi:3-oxoadipate enol-lactonase